MFISTFARSINNTDGDYCPMFNNYVIHNV